MLNNLEIKNGVLTPFYDIYNDIYTVKVEENVNSLEIYYDLLDPDTNVVINNNNNLENNSVVLLELKNASESRTITINIIKEDEMQTSGLKDYFTKLELKKKEEMPEFIAPLIGVSCFFIIVIIFSVLFHKKRKKN